MGDRITLLYILFKIFPLILCLFCIPFCLTTFIIGVINIRACPVQPLIPIWILVTGVILFIPTLTACLRVSKFFLLVLISFVNVIISR